MVVLAPSNVSKGRVRVIQPSASGGSAGLIKTFRTPASFFHYCCRLYPRNSQDSDPTLHRPHEVPDTCFGNQTQRVSYALDDFPVGFAIRYKEPTVLPGGFLNRS